MYSFLGVLRTAITTWSSTLPRAPGMSGSLNTAPTGGLYFGFFSALGALGAATVAGAAEPVTDAVEAAPVADTAGPPHSTISSGASRVSATVAGTTRTARI